MAKADEVPWWKFWGNTEIQDTQVVEPYIEVHTGPGRGYPVFYVAEQGEWVSIEKRKTSWIKIILSNGKSGWAARKEIEKTIDGAGQKVAFSDPKFDDFSSRRWEAGVLTGEFGGASVNSLYLGYLMTPNLSLEAGVQQVLGDFSQNLMLTGSLIHQPFPHWKLSPFFSLGGGMVFIRPKATLVREENREEQSAHAGAGLRYYLTDRYFIRAEYREYVVFTDRDENEEAEEWKIGLSVFF